MDTISRKMFPAISIWGGNDRPINGVLWWLPARQQHAPPRHRSRYNGGCVIQFTVFSAEELRDAQVHPERYENLQVRVCGWNVCWNDMCKAEQDAFIRRAENVMR